MKITFLGTTTLLFDDGTDQIRYSVPLRVTSKTSRLPTCPCSHYAGLRPKYRYKSLSITQKLGVTRQTISAIENDKYDRVKG